MALEFTGPEEDSTRLPLQLKGRTLLNAGMDCPHPQPFSLGEKGARIQSTGFLIFAGIIGLAFNAFRLVGQCLEQLLEIKRVSIGNLAVICSSSKIVQDQYRHNISPNRLVMES